MILHPYLESYRTEHAEIRTALQSCIEAKNWKGFFSAAAELVPPHGRREELFLFPAIAAKAESRAGGPLCLLYFDMHSHSPPLERAARATDRPLKRPEARTVAPHLRALYEKNSPACIPIEDHLALAEICDGALTCPPTQLEFLAHIYLSVLKLHFEKEENCLLPMCQSLLTQQELDTWAQAAHLSA